MSNFLPKGLRPPGLVPAVPRVIYQTRRKDLTHEGRIGRIDTPETLAAFHRFSRQFNAWRPRLPPEEAAPLHNRGFLPDKAALFGAALADPAEGDRYLSDLQAMVMGLVNGARQAALSNRLLFWQLHKDSLPLAELAGSVQRGRLILRPGQDPAGPFLSRPMQAGDDSPGTSLDDLSALDAEGPARIALRLPRDWPKLRLLRLLVIHDPKSRLPVVLGAVAIPLAEDLAPWQVDQPGAVLRVARIDPETGFCSPYAAMIRASMDPPPGLGATEAPAVADWWALRIAVTAGLARMPMIGAVQLDVLETGACGVVIDATDRPDTAALQRHGPLMGSAMAVDFLREFGL